MVDDRGSSSTDIHTLEEAFQDDLLAQRLPHWVRRLDRDELDLSLIHI